MDPQRWGVDTGYHDLWGNWHEAPESTLQAISAAMNAEGDAPPPAPVIFVRRGESKSLGAPADLRLEDGGQLTVEDRLPPDLPIGYHEVVVGDGPPRRLIVTPGRCYLPHAVRERGWAVGLYALRSRSSWGFGDLRDLRRLAECRRAWVRGWCLSTPCMAPTPIPRSRVHTLPEVAAGGIRFT
jgi:4-alpha-glucanotransferase